MNDSNDLSRRDLLQSTLVAGGALAAASWMTSPTLAAQDRGLPAGSTILFQGDSITDCGRHRKAKGANDARGMGRGYPYLLGAYLLATQPDRQYSFFNRGISGNKVPDLAARWKEDAVDLKPHLLSILIGVNDIWHKLGGGYDGTVEDYENGFTELLEGTKKALPGTRIVVCEPFVLRCGAVNDGWFPEFDERRKAAHRVASAAGATWVPFQKMFDDALEQAKPEYWAGDGVHPSMAGHALMAGKWLEIVGA